MAITFQQICKIIYVSKISELVFSSVSDIGGLTSFYCHIAKFRYLDSNISVFSLHSCLFVYQFLVDPWPSALACKKERRLNFEIEKSNQLGISICGKWKMFTFKQLHSSMKNNQKFQIHTRVDSTWKNLENLG